MTKEDLRVTRTKKTLFNSFLQLTYIESKKIQDISVQQICDLAMVHRSTFYKYYTDKYDLFFKEVEKFFHEEFTDEQLKKVIIAPFQILTNFESFTTIEKIAILNVNDDYFNTTVQNFVQRFLMTKFKALKIDDSIPIPIEVFVEIYASTIASLNAYWIRNGKQEQPETLDNYIKALGNPTFFNS